MAVWETATVYRRVYVCMSEQSEIYWHITERCSVKQHILLMSFCRVSSGNPTYCRQHAVQIFCCTGDTEVAYLGYIRNTPNQVGTDQVSICARA